LAVADNVDRLVETIELQRDSFGIPIELFLYQGKLTVNTEYEWTSERSKSKLFYIYYDIFAPFTGFWKVSTLARIKNSLNTLYVDFSVLGYDIVEAFDGMSLF